jgi:hypothetical protein
MGLATVATAGGEPVPPTSPSMSPPPDGVAHSAGSDDAAPMARCGASVIDDGSAGDVRPDGGASGGRIARGVPERCVVAVAVNAVGVRAEPLTSSWARDGAPAPNAPAAKARPTAVLGDGLADHDAAGVLVRLLPLAAATTTTGSTGPGARPLLVMLAPGGSGMRGNQSI